VRVAVFIDWSNVYRGAREAFGLENKSGRRGQIDEEARDVAALMEELRGPG